VKSGRTPGGSRAATSHTGALAGSDAAVEALFHQSGVIRTDTIEELFDTALLLGSQPIPAGPRVAILTNAGGPGIMAADACESAGLTLPTLEPKTIKGLKAFLPPEASTRNPVDMIASAVAESFEKALRLLVVDRNVDAVIVIFVPPLVTGAPEVARAILAGAAGSKKPVLSCFMGSHGVPESLKSLNEGHIPSYSFPEAAARTLARVARYGQWRSARAGVVPTLTGIDPRKARAAIEAAEPGAWMPPALLADLLQAYGVRTNPLRVAATRGEAAVMAKAVGFPAALKLRSPDVVHKSDVGGVKLGIRSEEDAARAFDSIARALKEHDPKARFEGVTVERMVDGGMETIIGMTRDPSFGPVVLFGLGGVTVELLRDVSLRVAPLTDTDAAEMLREIRGAQLLEGYRGAPPVNQDGLRDMLHRVSRLALDRPEIVELDLNPVLAFPGEAPPVALDARLKLAPAAPASKGPVADGERAAEPAGAA